MMLVPRRNFDIFDSFFDDPFFNSNENKMMKTDIKENENNYEVLIDLPGFNKEDIKMHIDNGYLIVSAKTNNEIDDKDENGKFIRKERYYGECSRSFYVGEEVKEENIKASYKNGTLNIEIPKLEIEEKKSEKKYIEISD